jgi:hypothetical protein
LQWLRCHCSVLWHFKTMNVRRMTQMGRRAGRVIPLATAFNWMVWREDRALMATDRVAFVWIELYKSKKICVTKYVFKNAKNQINWFKVENTCGDTTRANVSYFVNPNWPQSFDEPSSCTFKVNKINEQVIQKIY